MIKLKKYKIAVFDEKTKAVLIKHGIDCGYHISSTRYQQLLAEDIYFLYFSETPDNNYIIHSGSCFNVFLDEITFEQIYPHSFLKLTAKDVIQKKQFDIKDFDKVLVRNNVSDVWQIDLFKKLVLNTGNPYVFKCFNGTWHFIAKYNDNTKKWKDTITGIDGSFKFNDNLEIDGR